MRMLLTAALGLAIAAPGFAATDKQPPSRMPSEMTPTEIKAYNADITEAHPYYIKCRKTEVIGSLARKLRVCRTNEQWKESSAKGNENSRDLVEGFGRMGGTNNN
mgnify:CR=1 FL=1